MGKYSKEDLLNFQPNHDYFIGIDSDGCVFDTMDVKQKQFFHTEIIRFWGLEAVERELRAAAEFVNLYSKWRGTNRFPALLKTFELLADWPEARARLAALPPCDALRAYIESGVPMSNATLKQRVEETGDPELQRILDWSLAVNAAIAGGMQDVPPFPWVRESLDRISTKADVIVVSQTPEEALVHEWALHGIDHHVKVIAGQELGTKAEHLAMATDDRYPAGRILMIGDAPGDRKAAKAVNARFFPILPGREEDSWKRFFEEACERFFAGTFDAAYQEALNAEFEALLPEIPPWKA